MFDYRSIDKIIRIHCRILIKDLNFTFHSNFVHLIGLESLISVNIITDSFHRPRNVNIKGKMVKSTVEATVSKKNFCILFFLRSLVAFPYATLISCRTAVELLDRVKKKKKKTEHTYLAFCECSTSRR